MVNQSLDKFLYAVRVHV